MTPDEQRAGASAIADALARAGLKRALGGDGRWVTVTCDRGARHLDVVLGQAGIYAHVEKTRAALVFRVHPRHAQCHTELRLLRSV